VLLTRFHGAACATLFLSLGLLASTFVEGSSVPGVPNFHKVDDHLFRGGQPSPEGFHNLAHFGIRTVLDLRDSPRQSELEKRLVEKAGMRYVHVAMSPTQKPTDRQVSDALAVVDDSSAWPVFVHCAGGRDRTGAVVACYRISHYKWSNREAMAEARREGLTKPHDAQYIEGYRPPPGEGKGNSSASSGSH
jgi:protein tyrosine/serine phosphatase